MARSASPGTRGSLGDGLIFDAVRARLMEIGEAVKDVDPALLAQQPLIPWWRYGHVGVAGSVVLLAHPGQDEDLVDPNRKAKITTMAPPQR